MRVTVPVPGPSSTTVPELGDARFVIVIFTEATAAGAALAPAPDATSLGRACADCGCDCSSLGDSVLRDVRRRSRSRTTGRCASACSARVSPACCSRAASVGCARATKARILKARQSVSQVSIH